MADAPVLRERLDDGIEVVRLNRPDKRNALDTASLALLNAALDELAADETLRVLVLSTTSTRALCAGADVGERLDHDGGVARMAAFTRLYSALDAFPVPVVAVCVGNCVGAGAEIVAGATCGSAATTCKLAWAGARLGVPVGPARLAPLSGWPAPRTSSSPAASSTPTRPTGSACCTRAAPAEQAEAAARRAGPDRSPRSRPGGVRVLKQMFRDLDRTPRAGRLRERAAAALPAARRRPAPRLGAPGVLTPRAAAGPAGRTPRRPS